MKDLSIRWIGQSGYILCDGEHEICIDPYLSNVVDRIAHRGRMVEAPISPEEIESDAIICTHNHLDHVDIDAIPRMNKEKMRFLAPTDAKKTLLDCGVSDYIPFDVGSEFTLGNFKIRATPARHSIPAVGVIIEHNGRKIYFSGDTEYDESLCSLAGEGIDIMFICINGKLGNMNVSDAVKLTEIISPRLAIPTHYGMFESNTENPLKFTSQISNGFIMEHAKEYCLREMLQNV